MGNAVISLLSTVSHPKPNLNHNVITFEIALFFHNSDFDGFQKIRIRSENPFYMLFWSSWTNNIFSKDLLVVIHLKEW